MSPFQAGSLVRLYLPPSKDVPFYYQQIIVVDNFSLVTSAYHESDLNLYLLRSRGRHLYRYQTKTETLGFEVLYSSLEAVPLEEWASLFHQLEPQLQSLVQQFLFSKGLENVRRD